MSDSNPIYDANIAAFGIRYKAIADHLQGLNVTPYHLQRAASGEPYLKILTPSGSVFIDDAADPRKAARDLLPPPHDKKALFIVMGIGLGYLLFEARKSFPNARFLVIEPEPFVFKRALECFDFTGLFADPRMEFDVALDPGLLPRFFINFFARDDHHVLLPTVELISNPKTVKLTPDYYKTAGELFSQAVTDFWNHNTGNTYTDALIGLKYVLENLRHLDRMLAFDAYRGIFKDRIGVVVSSGPSLDSKLDRLREIQDRVVLICADSALQKLLSSGIKPFAAAILERDDVNAELFEGYDIPPEVTLIAPPLVKPTLTRSYPGPILTMFRHSYPFYWLPKFLACEDIGSSCAHLAFQALRHFGCREIALVGQDLAYQRYTGSSHYDGVLPFAAEQFGAMERIAAEDNQGGQIQTTEFWVMFRNIFSDLIAVNKMTNVSNVIESDFGLRIPGTRKTPPDEFFAQALAEPTGMRPLDVDPGRKMIDALKKDFLSELPLLVRRTLTQFEKIRPEVAAFASAANVGDYFARRDRVYSALEPKAKDLLDELLRPHQRRFEAAAFALWRGQEFASELPKYAELAVRILDELILTLQESPFGSLKP